MHEALQFCQVDLQATTHKTLRCLQNSLNDKTYQCILTFVQVLLESDVSVHNVSIHANEVCAVVAELKPVKQDNFTFIKRHVKIRMQKQLPSDSDEYKLPKQLIVNENYQKNRENFTTLHVPTETSISAFNKGIHSPSTFHINSFKTANTLGAQR